jgi:DNA-binding winged helix-turn-helix (wHTH) protein
METATGSETSIRFQNFELDLRTRELYRNGSRLKVRGHPVEVLAILLGHPGELITRDALKKRIWPDDTFVDFEQILNNSVGKLRDALGDRAETPKFIETLPRLGYRFIAPLEKSEIDTHVAQAPIIAEPKPPVPIPIIVPEPHCISKHWIAWPLVAIAVAAFGVVGYWYAHLPLSAPHIAHYEQLTLDGRRKIPRGTDGSRVLMNLAEPGRGILQVPISGGKVTEFLIDLPGGASLSPPVLLSVSPDGSNLLVSNQPVSGTGFMTWVVGNLGHSARYLTTVWDAGWSSDGRTVVFTNSHSDIQTISVDGGEPRLLHREDGPADQLTRTQDITRSPDGTTIRFTRLQGKSSKCPPMEPIFTSGCPVGMEECRSVAGVGLRMDNSICSWRNVRSRSIGVFGLWRRFGQWTSGKERLGRASPNHSFWHLARCSGAILFQASTGRRSSPAAFLSGPNSNATIRHPNALHLIWAACRPTCRLSLEMEDMWHTSRFLTVFSGALVAR